LRTITIRTAWAVFRSALWPVATTVIGALGRFALGFKTCGLRAPCGANGFAAWVFWGLAAVGFDAKGCAVGFGCVVHI
jgi:hypothetical protein